MALYKVSGTTNEDCIIKLFQGNKFIGYTYVVVGAYDAVFDSDVSDTVQIVSESMAGEVIGYSKVNPVSTADPVSISPPNYQGAKVVKPILGCQGDTVPSATTVYTGKSFVAKSGNTTTWNETTANAELVNVADITNPSSWTTIYEEDFGEELTCQLNNSTGFNYLYAYTSASNTALYRFKFSVDDVVILDVDMHVAASGDSFYFNPLPSTEQAQGVGGSYTSLPFVANKVKFEGCRQGNFTSSTSFNFGCLYCYKIY